MQFTGDSGPAIRRNSSSAGTVAYDDHERCKIWAHSGDSHFLEPDDLWHQILPKEVADRMPRTEMISENEERVTVDGKSFTRSLPKS